MKLETLVVSPFATNCFIIGCDETQEAAVIDPGDDGAAIADAASDLGLTVKKILLTHGHTDHVSGAQALKDATGAEVLIHEKDVPLLREAPSMALMFGWSVDDVPGADGHLSEGDTVRVGTLSFQVLHTPGHSPGGVSLLGDGLIFVGDTLFAGSIGRTDLPGGSHQQLISEIKKKILVLPDDTRVFTGHGPETTVGHEKANNPFVGTGRMFL